MKKLLDRLFPVDDLIETIKRFPFSVACAVALFIIALTEIHDVIDYDDEIMGRVAAVLSCMYFWFGISRIITESTNASRVKHMVIAGMGLVGVSSIVVFSPVWWQNLLFLSPAILLFLMFAPYLKGGDDTSVWFYNRSLWIGVAVSYLALLMFAGGVCLAMWAVERLFDVDFGYRVFSDLWAFSCLILGPIYALSWVPKKFEFTSDECNTPNGLKFIANWISVPMVFVYLGILYSYFAKMMITGEIPNGILAYLISGFVGAGVVTYLVSWPLREKGSVQLRFFHKIFFPALIIPVGFHFYAIWERIGAYGVTEQRYYILLTAIWFAMIAIANIKRKMPIKAIPATLAILLVFASFGPWGAVSVSGQSQFKRLEALLIKNDLVEDGKVKKAQGSIPFDDRLSISSILDYLCGSERDEMIEGLFVLEDKEKSGRYRCSSYKLTKEQLGFDYVSHYSTRDPEQLIQVWSNRHDVIREVEGYKYLIKDGRVNIEDKAPCKSKQCQIDDPKRLYVSFDNKSSILKFKHNSIVLLEDNIFEFLMESRNYQNSDEILFLKFENDRLSLRLDVNSIYGKIEDDRPVLNSMTFDLFYLLKDEQ